MLHSSAPITLVQRASSKNDRVSVLLCSQVEGTLVIVLNQPLKVAADHGLVHRELVLGIVRNLEKHGAHKIAAVKYLKVDLHVERHLTFRLFLLELLGFVLVAGVALTEELLVLGIVLADVYEEVVGFVDATETEGSKASLGQGSVVHDLVINVHLA